MIALGAVAIGMTLALFFAANDRLRKANRDTTRAEVITAAAFDLRSHVLDLESSFQAVVVTGSERQLKRWHLAERAWKGSAAKLERAAAAGSGEQRRVDRLSASIQAYIVDYGRPVIEIAKVSPEVARSSVAHAEGLLRIEQILRSTDELSRLAARDAALRSASADRLAFRASVVGVIALLMAPLFLILLGVWLARAVARPLVRAVDAASQVAGGDFSARLDERRRDEFGTLGRAFNAMTSSLATTHEELVARADALEVSERHKTQLISMVSHEIRTPLSSVLGFSRLLLERELEEIDRRRYLEIIDSEATRLASLVSDFLDARLLEEGQFTLTLEPLDIGALITEQATILLAHHREHHLDLKIGEDPIRVSADKRRLAQVIDNLLSNAIKYSTAGTAITMGAAAASASVRIWVENDGPGISLEHQDQIFQPFYRGGAPAAGIPGTGLGLAVSRQIVEAHGGSMGFDAGPTTTRFWVELPFAKT